LILGYKDKKKKETPQLFGLFRLNISIKQGYRSGQIQGCRAADDRFLHHANSMCLTAITAIARMTMQGTALDGDADCSPELD